ncbi:cupin domain-containing protein [Phlyctema vagabunda]|uniref:Cupin domain-containing protein n=1 Tax=Phlyctema vagabunda TaxID=108571 RepID=A0ABR4PFK8_9HELO
MAAPARALLENGLPDIYRYITSVNAEGKAVVTSEVSSSSVWQKIGNIAYFFLAFTTRGFPVSLANSTDIASYTQDLSSPPGLTVSNGTVLRFVDMAPNETSPMHKTVSLDYGIVIEGPVELVLDSGETKLLQRGDTCIQRATNHAWRNPNNHWARVLFVLVPVEKGEGIEESLGGMEIKSSD